MRKLFILLAMTAAIFVQGCATPQSAEATKTWLNKNESVIRAAVKLVRRVAVRYAVKDPAKAVQLNGQIDQVAFQVNQLLAQGAFDPEAVAAALKAEDPNIETALDALNVIYSAAYGELQDRDQIQLATIILRDIAVGLSPPAPVANSDNSPLK